MKLDPEVLARVQFAFTVTFHIIFPTMSIGLAAFLAIIEGLWLKTKDPVYLEIYRFWMAWILSANSWMQTPDGITIENGRVVVTNWLRVIHNPSWLVRLPHMLMAASCPGGVRI
jgi:cytochrome bd-type quinol oxidase subunit 1